MKLKQFEQPGDLVTLPSGIQFRELLEGSGRAAALGSKISIRCAPAPAMLIYKCYGRPRRLLFKIRYQGALRPLPARRQQERDACKCRYTVYKLAPGAYFKYSSGGTPVLLFALGYGTEGQKDVGDTYTCVLGDKTALPIAATLGLVGMRVGGVPSCLHRAALALPQTWPPFPASLPCPI